MSKVVLDEVVSGYGLSKINENFQKIQDELNDKVLYRDNPDGETNTLEQDVDVNGFSLYNIDKINNVSVNIFTDNIETVFNNIDLIDTVAENIDNVNIVAGLSDDIGDLIEISDDIAALAPYAEDISEYATGIYNNLASGESGKGAELIEYKGGTVESALSSRLPELANYAALDSYTGDLTSVYVKGIVNGLDGGHGIFRRTTETPTEINGIYRQDGVGRWWKREYTGDVKIQWFEQPSDISGVASGDWKEFPAENAENINYLNKAIILENGVARVSRCTPEVFGNGFAASFNGGQLSRLAQALADPLHQQLNVVFIGDSITWGGIPTGADEEEPRDRTLSDPRNNADSCSFFNEVRKWVQRSAGLGATVAFSNHPASPSGQSIATITKTIPLFPRGDDFTVAFTGVVTDAVTTGIAGTLCNAYRNFGISNSVAGSGVTIKFDFTGTQFDVVFAALSTGAHYNVFVNGTQLSGGPFTTVSGEDGLTTGFKRRRTHTIPYVKHATITISAFKPASFGSTGTCNFRFEGIEVTKTIKMRNQGIYGATSRSYLSFCFPTSALSGLPFKTADASGVTATPSGSTTSKSDYVDDSYQTGVMTAYGFNSSSGWELVFPVSATKEKISISFSAISTGCDIEVYAGATLVTTFSTSSLSPGAVSQKGAVREVTLPGGTTSVKLVLVYNAYSTSIQYLRLEGIANYAAADVTYPTNNAQGDGVALADGDDFVFYQLGTNDRGVETGSVSASNQTARNIAAMIDLMPIGAEPVIMCAPPAGSDFDDPPTRHSIMTDQRNALIKLAKNRQIDFIDNYSIFDTVPPELFCPDDLHPGDLGNKIIASNIINSIKNAN